MAPRLADVADHRPALHDGAVVPERWRDAVYALVARNRYRWFDKVKHCILLTPEQRARLL